MKDEKNLTSEEIIYILKEINWFNAFAPYIFYKIIDKIIYNHRFKEDQKTKSPNDIKSIPEIKRKSFYINEAAMISKQFGYSILEFTKIITTNLPESNLILFYNNINDLIVNKKSFILTNIITNLSISGSYDTNENKIKINEKYLSSIYHELLHMSSSIYINNYVYTGFKQRSKHKAIGQGLNEGYTELLTERYFNQVKESTSSYPIELLIASKIESIVGKEKMENLYFNANLPGLIEELKKYDTEENVMEFICMLDFINKYSRKMGITKTETTICLNNLKKICDFLLRNYTKKILEEENINESSEEELREKMNFFDFEMNFIKNMYIRTKTKSRKKYRTYAKN